MPAILLVLVCVLTACKSRFGNTRFSGADRLPVFQYKEIGSIPVPHGFERLPVADSSFGRWLRTIPLQKDGQVHLYNGKLKDDQQSHYAVLDIPVGDRDLQQCADAIMRLRAEYLFSAGRFDEIVFSDNSRKSYCWRGKDNRGAFELYLVKVFSYCNSASLEKQVKRVYDCRQLQPGDMFIKGGFPGHAMIVVDVVVNAKGERRFLLAQSFMPAQELHIVKNLANPGHNPWYAIHDTVAIVTPGWTFYSTQLYRF